MICFDWVTTIYTIYPGAFHHLQVYRHIFLPKQTHLLVNGCTRRLLMMPWYPPQGPGSLLWDRQGRRNTPHQAMIMMVPWHYILGPFSSFWMEYHIFWNNSCSIWTEKSILQCKNYKFVSLKSSTKILQLQAGYHHVLVPTDYLDK